MDLAVFSAFLVLGLGPASSQANSQSDQDRIFVALTKSGVQVEATEAPAKGALEIQTPFGVFNTPTDPVAIVMKQTQKREWLTKGKSFNTFQNVLMIDNLTATGHLTELLELGDYCLRNTNDWESEERLLAVFAGIERWGARLDPVPKKTPYSKRTAWLWQQVVRTKGARSALYAGKLLEELPPGDNPSDDRLISLVELRKHFDHPNPLVRRTAALAAAKQGLSDLSLAVAFLGESIRGPHALVRDGAAQAAKQLWPEYALNFWFLTVTRSRDSERLAAAQHLALYGGDSAIDYLMFALSAMDKRSPRRFKFGEKQVQVVKEVRSPSLPLVGTRSVGECNSAELYAITPDYDQFAITSVVTVTKPSQAVTDGLLRAITRWSGEPNSERDAKEWLEWYENLKREERERKAKKRGA